MPEYPDITVYIESMSRLILGQRLLSIRLISPFFLRTVSPAIDDFTGKRLMTFERLGKRIVFVFEKEYFLIVHLMVAGRLHWKPVGTMVSRKVGLATLDFESGCLTVTESGTKKRASLHLVADRESLSAFDRGGINVMESSLAAFSERLLSENHTLKRALTDPRLFDGIGNAYSDEILHAAELSPALLTSKMKAVDIERLYHISRSQLQYWTEKLRHEAEGAFPEKVTAFRPDMAVHGKFGQPCPRCRTAVQRIRYADNETNYCPRCQTSGKLLSDRSLARLLR
ncbi:MAG: formamidopyrimidine-DNA glycosylase, partial [Calditrichaeota bacterium]